MTGKAPYYIRAVLDACTLPHPEINPAVKEELMRDQMIYVEEGGIRNTERALAYCRLLEEVPLPVQIWTDPRIKT